MLGSDWRWWKSVRAYFNHLNVRGEPVGLRLRTGADKEEETGEVKAVLGNQVGVKGRGEDRGVRE